MESDAFKKKVSEEYAKWLLFVTGKTERVDVPFFPVTSFDRGMFSDFVAELVTKTIAPDFNMLSLITDKGKPVFMLVERVEKGRFVSIKVLDPSNGVEEVKKEHGVTITKSVERSVLEDVFVLQEKYGRLKDKRTYLLELIVLLANALKQEKLVFTPTPPVVKALLKAISRVNIDMKLLMGLRDHLASIEMTSGKRSLFLDLGTPVRIVVQKEHLFSLLEKLPPISSLSDLVDACLIWLADGFKKNSIRIEPASFIWKGVENIVEHDARRVGEKMKFMLSMFADPLFILLMVGDDSYLLEFRKGVIAGIERIEQKGNLKQAWLEMSQKRTFIHLALRTDPKVLESAISPLHLPEVLKKGVYEFYPKNEFVAHLNEMGSLNLFLKLVYPFVND